LVVVVDVVDVVDVVAEQVVVRIVGKGVDVVEVAQIVLGDILVADVGVDVVVLRRLLFVRDRPLDLLLLPVAHRPRLYSTSSMSIRVYIDGEMHDEKTAVIPIFDRGFLYGDSVYEVTRTVGGRPLDLDLHLDRLDRSSVQIGIPILPRAELHRAIQKTLDAAANPDSYLRVIVTRGAGEINLDPAAADRPRLIVLVKELKLPSDEDYRRGVDVALVGVVRNARRAVDPAVKSGNYLNNILAVAEAKRNGAYEAFMLNAAGRLVEGSTCNVFVVKRGVVRTPAVEDGLLDGITRRRILELAAGAG